VQSFIGQFLSQLDVILCSAHVFEIIVKSEDLHYLPTMLGFSDGPEHGRGKSVAICLMAQNSVVREVVSNTERDLNPVALVMR